MRELDKLFQELRRRNMFRVAGAYAVVGWLLMQLAVVLETSLNLPSWFDTFVTVMVLIGLPIALFLAWAFELTPDGVRPTASIPDEDSISHRTGRKLEYAILAGLVAIAALMITDQMSHPDPHTTPLTADTAPIDAAVENTAPILDPPAAMQRTAMAGNKSVAVLPFDNRSPIESDAYFAAGVHDDLLTQLSKMSALQVISRTSVMAYADTEKKIPEIALELGVSAVLEGAVQRGGNRVQITAQLIDGKTDHHLWAEKYDRELTTDNIFEIQSEITLAIAETLEAVLSGRDKAQLDIAKTKSLPAYDSYIRGKIKTQPGASTEAELLEAIEAFDKAIALDPKFADAWAGKANAQLSKFWFFGRDAAFSDAAKLSLDEAFRLAPDNLDAQIVKAFYEYWGLQDYESANQSFDAALESAPNNAQAFAGKAFILRRLGRFKESAEALRSAHRLDPLAYYLLPEMALTYSLIGEFDNANQAMARAKELDPNSQFGAFFDAAILQFQGDKDKAWDVVWTLEEAQAGQFYEQLAAYAIASRDPKKIEMVRGAWPEDKRNPENAPENYTIFNIVGLKLSGDMASAQKEIDALRKRYKKSGPAPASEWSTNQSYSPIVIPGIIGDLAAVKQTHAEYEKDAASSADALTRIEHLSDIADAYARAGDPDTAFKYLNDMIDLTGPQMFLVVEDAPSYDALRSHPQYLEMQSAYNAWAAKHPWKKR